MLADAPAISTLSQLRSSGWKSRSVKRELRENFTAALAVSAATGADLFPGIVGYDDTVLPEVANAILAEHDMLFLGEKGQGKSRLMRLLPRFLDEWLPCFDLPGCAVHEDPERPITRAAREMLASTPPERVSIVWWHRDERYGERLAPGTKFAESYLVEVVVRTLDIGHEFTQGTADSNEAWLYARATSGGREVGTTGGLDATSGELDPWSRKFNAFVIDRDGNRIDRRNPQDIFQPLYNNQIPPGAGDVTHLVLEVPGDADAPIEIETEVRYRKFDTTYLRYVFGPDRVNDLPVIVLARDRVTLPVRARSGEVHGATSAESDPIPAWQRWHDYGIGLFREGDRAAGRGATRQADEAFAMVEATHPAVGAYARARLAIREGRLDDASALLARAAKAAAEGATPALPWGIAYFTALVDKQNGNFAEAIEGFRRVLATDFAGARERGFDFSIDTRVLNELAETALEASRLGRGEGVDLARVREAKATLEASLAVDPEQAQAWWLMNRACEALGDAPGAEAARARHAIYKPDETARDRATRLARAKYPWADVAAEATVLYAMQREARFTDDLLPGTRIEVPGLPFAPAVAAGEVGGAPALSR